MKQKFKLNLRNFMSLLSKSEDLLHNSFKVVLNFVH
jgi:hypothetical protein